VAAQTTIIRTATVSTIVISAPMTVVRWPAPPTPLKFGYTPAATTVYASEWSALGLVTPGRYAGQPTELAEAADGGDLVAELGQGGQRIPIRND